MTQQTTLANKIRQAVQHTNEWLEQTVNRFERTIDDTSHAILWSRILDRALYAAATLIVLMWASDFLSEPLFGLNTPILYYVFGALTAGWFLGFYRMYGTDPDINIYQSRISAIQSVINLGNKALQLTLFFGVLVGMKVYQDTTSYQLSTGAENLLTTAREILGLANAIIAEILPNIWLTFIIGAVIIDLVVVQYNQKVV